MPSKLKGAAALSGILRKLRSKGRKIVFTNGCFDILHPGHVSYLEKASRMGDVLVVGLNSDASSSGAKTGPCCRIMPNTLKTILI